MGIDPFLLEAESLLFFLVFLPLGDLAIQFLARLLHRTLLLTPLERALSAFFATGGILYAVAYVPGGMFYPVTVLGLLTLGGIGWAGRYGLQVSRGVRRLWTEVGSWDPSTVRLLIVFLTTIALFTFECFLFAPQVAPNTFDGSMQVDFQMVLLHTHAAAHTLEPFAPMGVTYPQGSPVLFATASILLGWPVLLTPVYLIPLYLALFLPAAYVWVRRVWGAKGEPFGVLLVVFLAGVETWPRFLVGGSYDFLMALPLFILTLGLSERVVPLRRGTDALLLGIACGIMAALSLVAAEAFIATIGLLTLYRLRTRWATAVPALGRLALSAGISGIFILPSILGTITWWSYPQHVLTPSGGGAVPTTTVPESLVSQIPTLLDPFLFRPQDVWLSPFPSLKAVLALLLLFGFVIVVLDQWRVVPWSATRISRPLLDQMAAIGIASGALILAGVGVAGFLTTGYVPTNLTELSIILFAGYGILAVFPTYWACRWLGTSRKRDPRAHPFLALLAATLLAVPLATGMVVTATSAPTYLSTLQGELANVSPADLAALQWAGAHLPSCSTVLVAPGSAGQFLPAYGPIHLDFPMDPGPRNSSYTLAVDDLVNGTLTNETLRALQTLSITEVFVTGQSNVLWKPLLPLPFEEDPGTFPQVFHPSGSDAYIFEYEPVATSTGCVPA